MSDDIARGLINLVAISVLGLMIKQNALFSPKERRASLLAVASVIVAIVAEAITFSLAAPPNSPPYWQINKLFCAIGFGITPFVPFLMAVAFGVRGGGKKTESFMPDRRLLMLYYRPCHHFMGLSIPTLPPMNILGGRFSPPFLFLPLCSEW